MGNLEEESMLGYNINFRNQLSFESKHEIQKTETNLDYIRQSCFAAITPKLERGKMCLNLMLA